VVEAFMNTAGISYVPDYEDFSEFNLSKHQSKYSAGTVAVDGDDEEAS
jgi:hypothetical protein